MGAEGIRMRASAGFTAALRAKIPVVGGALVAVVTHDIRFAGTLASATITVTNSISAVRFQSARGYTSAA